MKFTQSRLQGVIFRFKRLTIQISLFLFLYLTLVYIFKAPPKIEALKIHLLGLCLLPVLTTLWLSIFNSGKGKVDEYSLEFTDSHITYRSLYGNTIIPMSDKLSIKTQGKPPNSISITGDNHSAHIDLNLFSPQQRKEIIKKCHFLKNNQQD